MTTLRDGHVIPLTEGQTRLGRWSTLHHPSGTFSEARSAQVAGGTWEL